MAPSLEGPDEDSAVTPVITARLSPDKIGSINRTLVARVGHFQEVDGLVVEQWEASPALHLTPAEMV